MKKVCWVLFGLSVILFLLGVYGKFSGQENWILGFRPVAWWRAAMGAVVYAMAVKLIFGDGKQLA